MAPRASRLDAFKQLIDDMLRADLDAPRKQRHTAKRIFTRLVDEHQAAEVSYQMVRAYFAKRRGEIRMEAGRDPPEAFVPQSHLPGVEAEVDFGDVTVRIAGEQVRCFLFSFRLSYSGKAVHRVLATGGQEAFFEGHVHAFTVLGGVPTGKVRYDNLKAAVSKVLGFSRARTESARWTAFRSHYGIEAFYCQPGIKGAHEKGGVEGDIGWFRRNHLVPVPEVASLDELNELIDLWDAQDEGRRIGARARTVGEYFAIEQPKLRPVPDEPFETGLLLPVRVDRYSQVTVRTNRYSVPARFIGRQLRVMLHASHLIVYDGQQVVAEHERLFAKGGRRLELDHYLEVLVRKPGALPGATALEQARAAGKFTPVHDAWWAAACKAHGDRDGTRALIEVLLLARHISIEHLVTGLAAALRAGAHTADAVALEARKAAEEDQQPPPPAPADDAGATVTFLTERRLAQLPRDTRPLPSVAVYDQLLKRAQPTGERPARRTTMPPPHRGMTEQAAQASIDQACRMLRLPSIRAQFPELAESAARDQMSYLGFLAELLMAECDDRARRRSERRIKAAQFPRDKSLRAFDFDANPNIDPATIHTLATCEWVKKGQPLCLIGDSGTGKSHLLIALGTEAAMKGYRVRYTLATKLVNELVEAADDKILAKTVARYGRVDLLCIDELGYMELDRHGAELLFQVLTEREEKNSVAIASNESFSGWTRTFTDPRLCAAIVDRLTFAGNIIETGTDSYRLAQTRARAERAS
ncbi:hypothetical protein GCM10020216_034680 [Nonomuraea helvata]